MHKSTHRLNSSVHKSDGQATGWEHSDPGTPAEGAGKGGRAARSALPHRHVPLRAGTGLRQVSTGNWGHGEATGSQDWREMLAEEAQPLIKVVG